MPSPQPAIILPTSSDYSDRDLAALRGRFRTLIQSVLPAWTDNSPANLGSLLTDLFAFQCDVMGFNIDAQAAEAFLATATQRASLLKLAAIMGYVPQGIAAATAVLTFKAVGLGADVVIKRG